MTDKPIILGIKYLGHDTAASLTKGAELVAACAQERYTLDKHSRRFPDEAIADCLRIGGVRMDDVDQIAFVGDLKYLVREHYLRPALDWDSRLDYLVNDFDRIRIALGMEDHVRQQTHYEGPIKFYRHHLCHAASTYYPSGFETAFIMSLDGIGERESTLLATGERGEIAIVGDSNEYPDSLGLIYSAITYYLGWRHHCDEGIVMGLAAFGNPHAKAPDQSATYYEIFEEIIRETGPYGFAIDMTWANYFGTRDKWISEKFIETFGPKREPGGPLEQTHRDLAAALQARLEHVVLNQLRAARDEFGYRQLCLAGGVALNCSMNGKIAASGVFDEIFVTPASGDDGTTIGDWVLVK
jgi:carbamoyltransferase